MKKLHLNFRFLAALCFISLLFISSLWQNITYVYAQELKANLSIIGEIQHSNVKDQAINPDNIIKLPTMYFSTSLVIDGYLEDVRYQLQGQYEQSQMNSNHLNSKDEVIELEVQELAKEFYFNDKTSLTLGKTNFVWDHGYGYQVLRFFETQYNYEIEDKTFETTGKPLASINYIATNWDVQAAITNDFEHEEDGYQLGLRQWALRYSYYFDLTSLSLILEQPQEERIGMGGAFTHVIGNNLELHGSLFARKGTRRPVHESLLTENFQFYTEDNNPVSSQRQRDNHFYPRWVLGGQWTSKNQINIIAEWVHDTQGLNDNEWDDYLALIDFHKNGAALGVSQAAIDANLAYDAQLFNADLVRHDYLFLRISRDFDGWQPSFSTMVGLADGGTSSQGRLDFEISSELNMWVNGTINQGPKNSEFALTPNGTYVGFGFRYQF